ncbi:MAG: tetratricopeptide repeat protein [Ramlibacter sp.]|nr:tetratricopeptide repeat protein [Ramlibacter sp.]
MLYYLLAPTYFQRPAVAKLICRVLGAACVAVPAAWAQPAAPAQRAASTCTAQPSYPLPTEPARLQALADRLESLATDPACLRDAQFHAWRGAVLLALGRPVEAVEPLERALMADPDLPGAQLDLAQALAIQGDTQSAVMLLEAVRARPDIDGPLRVAIDAQVAALTGPPLPAAAEGDRWYSRWRVTTYAGADSNLNNAPSDSTITLTFSKGDPTLSDLTLPLDPSSQPRSGGAMLAFVQWQGVRPVGESLWVVQAEVRGRHTAEPATRYQQLDLATAWLQAPSAQSQWVARTSLSSLRFANVTISHALRASLQREFPSLPGTGWSLLDATAGCKPTLAGELEQRRYPSQVSLNGLYAGAAAGLLCRPGNGAASGTSFFNVEARLGQERPSDEARAGGTYRRGELRAQWERRAFANGLMGVQWISTFQSDTEPYSILLGNIPRHVARHSLQLDASWPLGGNLSLVANAEAASQQSNISAFDSRQRSVYLGLRWEK